VLERLGNLTARGISPGEEPVRYTGSVIGKDPIPGASLQASATQHRGPLEPSPSSGLHTTAPVITTIRYFVFCFILSRIDTGGR
jgi:hypothetical protein